MVCVKYSLILATLMSTALTAACDPVYGVVREARLPRLPVVACVESVIRSTPGVESVDYRTYFSGRPLTWSGLKHPTEWHTFQYHGGTSPRISGTLSISKDYNGPVEFVQSIQRMGAAPDAAIVRATRPTMRSIELSLAAQCDLAELPRSVRESCDRVECPTLP
jgi:hypothetical protein